MKPDYKDFSVNDLVHDDLFIRWAKGGDVNSEWFWQSFINENPSKADEIAEAKRIVKLLQLAEMDLTPHSLESIKKSVLRGIQNEQEFAAGKNRGNDPSATRKGKNRLFLKIAAAISLPLIFSFLIYRMITHDDAISQTGSSHTENFDGRLEKRINPRGQKSVLFLADGSKVWLNAESTLNYEKDFTKGNSRELYLVGEAFFEVAHDPAKPFFVHTSDLTIRVQGTSFNVKSYADDEVIETTLVSGKVRIYKEGEHSSNASLILKPNQKAIFLKENKTINVEEISGERAAAWREDRLVFDETAFLEVITQLERWYDVKIHVDEPNDLDCTLTAHIEKESLVQVLSLLAASQKISYTIVGNEVYIKGSLCH